MMRVLIIDDSMAMRRMLDAYVRDLGAETVLAEDGQAALEALEREKPFDIALVDWDMPRVTGIEFVMRVRAMPEHAQLKLLMVTAHLGFEDIEQALTCGADDYLMKPVSSELVADKLRVLGLVA
jgi:two-component system chemotaxis response regulator CheY